MQSAQDYTYSATNQYGDCASLSFKITVKTALKFNDTPAVTNQIYASTVAVNTTLPLASGLSGSPTINYTLSPALPSGLSFDSSTRAISGTPTTKTAAATYTYTATSASDSTDTVSKTFTIEVKDLPPKPSSPTVARNRYEINSMDFSWTTVTADGGVTSYEVRYRTRDYTYQRDPILGSWTEITGISSASTTRKITNLDGGRNEISPKANPGDAEINPYYGRDYDFSIRARSALGAGPWSDDVKARTSGNINAWFPQGDSVTRSVAENSGAGTNVGAAVTANAGEDAGGVDSANHCISGTDASKFQVAYQSGQITVKSGTSLDYESKKSYSITIWVSDLKNTDGYVEGSITICGSTLVKDDTIDVTINVTDVNEPPGKPAAPTVSANATTPTTKLDVSWTALSTSSMAGKPPITDYDVRYRLSTTSTSTSSWTEWNASNTSTATSATLENLTSNKGYQVQVRAVNHEGNGPWSDSGSAITRGGGVTRSVAENSAAGTDVGAPVTATSNPNNYTLTHALSGTDADSFTIATSSGQIKVGAGTTLDYEGSDTSYSVIVTVTAVAGAGGANAQSLNPNAPGDYTIPVTINVTNVNEPPVLGPKDSVTFSVAENTAVGTIIAEGNADGDPEGDTLTFSTTGADADGIAISTTSGELSVKAGRIPNYEAKTTYNFSVHVTDGKAPDGADDNTIDVTITITINVDDVDEPPPAPVAPTVSANATTPTTKLDVSWTALSTSSMAGKPAVTDYDVRYRLSGASTWDTSTYSHTGTSTSATLSGLTSGKSYEVQVRATNDEGTSAWSDSGSGTTTAGGVTRSIAENSAAGTNIGAAVTATSTNTKYTYTHALGGTDAASFDIVSSSGQIRVKSALDYETKNSYSVTVTVTATSKGANTQSLDPNAPGDYTVPVTINVTDVNEPPPKLAAPSASANSTTPTSKIDVSWGPPPGIHMMGRPPVTDYDVQYRMNGAPVWTSRAHNGTTTSATLSGLTSGKSYEVQVRAVNADGNGPWSNSGGAITRGDGVTRSVAENSAAGTNVGAAVSATRNTTNLTLTFTYTLGGTDAASFSFNTSTGQITVKAALDYETKNSYSVIVTVKAAAAGAQSQSLAPNAPGDYTIPVTINVTDVNETPTFPDGNASTTRGVAENSAAGTNVGAAVSASDVDGDTLTYSLGGTDAASFDLDTSTGQITVKSALNYEAKTAYSVSVSVTDGENDQGVADTSTDATIPVTINVTDVSEPPPKLAAPSVAANATTPTSKLDASWTALTNTQMSGKPAVNDYDVQYRLSGDSSWTSHSHTGTSVSATLSNLTSNKSYEVQVRANNDEGNGPWSDSGSAITDGNAVTRSVAENSVAGTNVGAAVTADSNPNNYTLTHTLSGTDAGKFEIGGGTGQITVKSGTSLNYEAKTSYSVVVTVKAASAGIQSQSLNPNAPGDYTIPVTINVTDVNEPPTISTPTVVPNSTTPKTKLDVSWTAPTMTGKPAVTDYDLQYRVAHETGWSSHSFTGTGTSTTISGLTENEHYEVQVKAINDEGNSGWSNSGHATTNADSKTLTIDENSAASANVGIVTKSVSAGYAKTHTLSGTDAGKFTIATSTGQIKVGSGTNLNFEAKDHYDVVVEIEATKGSSALDYDIVVIIQVNDVAEPPPKPAAPTVTRSSTSPTSELDVSWTSPNMTGKPPIKDYDVQYRLNGDSSWTSLSHTGTKTSATLKNLTANKSYEVQVRATNAEGTGEWSDSGGAITKGGGITRSVAENSPAGTSVGPAVTATSNPNGYTLTYTLSGTDAGSFTIVSSSGQIRVKSALDYETKTSYSVIVTVKAASGGGGGAQTQSLIPNWPGDYTVPVTIYVTDVNETPAFDEGATTTRSVAENSPAGTNVGTAVSATDIDGDTLTYSLSGTDAASFDLDTSTGRIKTKAALDYEAKATYSVNVEVTDSETDSGQLDTSTDDTIAVTINIIDKNEPPTAPDAPTVTRNSSDPKTKLDVSLDAPGHDRQARLSPTTTFSTDRPPLPPGRLWQRYWERPPLPRTTLTNLEGGRRYVVQVRASNHEGTSALV